MLYLVAHLGETPQVWKLETPKVRVGRSSNNDIRIVDGTVSKEHAEIIEHNGGFAIRDLGSRNGTRVNGVEVRDARAIQAGDHIEVGQVMLSVTVDPGTPSVRYGERTVMDPAVKLRAEDVLDRSSAAHRSPDAVIRLLTEAGRLLVLPRPLRETCEEILAFVGKALPKTRQVLLLRDETNTEELLPIATSAREERVDRPLVLSRAIAGTVLDGTSVVTADAALDPRFMGNQSIVAQSVHSAMAVPLFDNKHVLGILYVDSPDPTVRFSSDQLEILTLLANMAAVKITNARLLEAEQERARIIQELASATRIQRGLLPSTLPETPGYELDAHLETCFEVGGDLYDLWQRSDGRVVFMLGDVTGKGLGAALLMSSFLASARVLYDTCSDMGELATRLGSIVHRSVESGNFVTGIVGCLDPPTGTVEIVNAGHPSACWMHGAELIEVESSGVPFGVVPVFPYRVQTLVLDQRDSLTLYSDGIIEAQHGDEFFEERRVHALLRGPDALLPLADVRRRLLEEVDGFLAGAHRTDDVSLLMIRRGDAAPATAPGA